MYALAFILTSLLLTTLILQAALLWRQNHARLRSTRNSGHAPCVKNNIQSAVNCARRHPAGIAWVHATRTHARTHARNFNASCANWKHSQSVKTVYFPRLPNDNASNALTLLLTKMQMRNNDGAA